MRRISATSAPNGPGRTHICGRVARRVGAGILRRGGRGDEESHDDKQSAAEQQAGTNGGRAGAGGGDRVTPSNEKEALDELCEFSSRSRCGHRKSVSTKLNLRERIGEEKNCRVKIERGRRRGRKAKPERAAVEAELTHSHRTEGDCRNERAGRREVGGMRCLDHSSPESEADGKRTRSPDEQSRTPNSPRRSASLRHLEHWFLRRRASSRSA